MRILLLLCAGSVPMALAGTFHLFDVDGKCLIYSVDNWNCTGSSERVGNLNGKNCYCERA